MEILTKQEAAKYLGISLSTLKKIQKNIRLIKLGRLVRFDKKDLDAYLEAQKLDV